MDDKGNIREFKSAEEAEDNGFRHQLTKEMADELLGQNQEDRLPIVMVNAYGNLLGRKMDTIEKTKLKNFAKFAISFLEKR